jgi:hypothetical protein
MTESALLENILDRLGRADSAEEIFGADEVADWPAGALDLLIKAGLLRRAEPAHAIECNGCCPRLRNTQHSEHEGRHTWIPTRFLSS